MSNKDPKIAALEVVYAALEPLDPQTRSEVISSVFALLGMTAPSAAAHKPASEQAPTTPTSTESQRVTHRARPKGLAELVNESKPGTNPQKITLFAYWREKYEGISRFAREDLNGYFAKAHLTPPKNYDRDFTTAVHRGWIHEDDAESYITTKGIEAVEASFEGERTYSKQPKKKKKTFKKSSGKKSPRSRRKHSSS